MKKYIYLAGGFGNNMFQICYGEYLESLGFNVVYKTSLLKKNIFTRLFKWTVHKNELTDCFLNNKEVDESLAFSDIVFLCKAAIKKFIKKDNLYKAPCAKSSNRFFGYFVIGEHLNQDSYSRLRATLEIVKPHVNKLNDCSIHLRKGDFSAHQRLTNKYYLDAISCLKNVGSFNLITDSPAELDNLTKSIDCELKPSGSKSMKSDFFEIYNSKVVIMSNSTFCYWAAVLGESEKLIYPSKISENTEWIFYLNKRAEMLNVSFESEL